MSWQKCPVCAGMGTYGTACRTCNGSGIINEQTGHAPERIIITTDNSIDIDKLKEKMKLLALPTCRRCLSQDISVERSPDGNSTCNNCGFSWPHKETK